MSITVRREMVESRDAARAAHWLAEWEPVNSGAWQMHVGDLGWALRLDSAAMAGGIYIWNVSGSGDERSVAVGLLEGPVLRLAISPGAAWDASISDALIDDALQLLPDGEAYVDGPAGVWRLSLARLGWQADPDSWVHFWRDISDASTPNGVETLRDSPGAMAERVATQRASFRNSTFTEDAWRRMASTGLYDPALDIVVRNAEGAAVAVATAWLAGRGKCSILEPVGTHQDFRGQGWGKIAVQGAIAKLRDAGASGAAVATPSGNEAAVALYQSAGFVPLESTRSMRRTAR